MVQMEKLKSAAAEGSLAGSRHPYNHCFLPPGTVSCHSQVEVSVSEFAGSTVHETKTRGGGETGATLLWNSPDTLIPRRLCKQLITLLKVLLGTEASSCLVDKLALYG